MYLSVVFLCCVGYIAWFVFSAFCLYCGFLIVLWVFCSMFVSFRVLYCFGFLYCVVFCFIILCVFCIVYCDFVLFFVGLYDGFVCYVFFELWFCIVSYYLCIVVLYCRPIVCFVCSGCVSWFFIVLCVLRLCIMVLFCVFCAACCLFCVLCIGRWARAGVTASHLSPLGK